MDIGCLVTMAKKFDFSHGIISCEFSHLSQISRSTCHVRSRHTCRENAGWARQHRAQVCKLNVHTITRNAFASDSFTSPLELLPWRPAFSRAHSWLGARDLREVSWCECRACNEWCMLGEGWNKAWSRRADTRRKDHSSVLFERADCQR